MLNVGKAVMNMIKHSKMSKRRNLYQCIYCSIRVKWFAEENIFHHLKSKCHRQRKLGKTNKTRQDQPMKTGEHSESEISFVLTGNTLISCDRISPNISPILFDSDTETESKIVEVMYVVRHWVLLLREKSQPSLGP